MSLPDLNITFKEKGITAISRGERGIVALILEDNVIPLYSNNIEMSLNTEIPENLSEFNKEQLELAFRGYVTPPKKVIACIVPKGTEESPVDYTSTQKELEATRFDYVAIPEIADSKVDSIATWVKSLRDTRKKKVKAVLPHCEGDHEGIINFTENKIVTKNKEFTTKEYCSRIAGLIAGTPLTIACTFAPLPEVISCDNRDRDELGEAIKKGELALYNDGDKVKIASGVNSLVTTIEGKGEGYQKIKIVEALDLMYDDIRKEVEDNYLGKYSNTYDNKCLLMIAIIVYLDEFEGDGILNRNHSGIELNLKKQTNYLKLKDYKMTDGRGVESMTELEIKKADTGDKVFLKGGVKVLDAIENIDLPIDI